VDRFAEGASPYGCLDLMGNVEEWTSTAGEGGSMMVLGSSWSRIGQIYGLPELHRLASPHFYSNEHGFRCARDGGE
jgi:formylglycine-generating enzyme required for sulfatase activity